MSKTKQPKTLAAAAQPGGMIEKLSAARAAKAPPPETPTPKRAPRITHVALPPGGPIVGQRPLQSGSVRSTVYAEAAKRAARAKSGMCEIAKLQEAFPDTPIKGHVQKLCATGHLVAAQPEAKE